MAFDRARAVAHFYLSDDASRAVVGEALAIEGPEARHAITVGRLAPGERLRIGDGRGTVAEGTVSLVARDRFEVSVESVSTEVPPVPTLWLAQALAKGGRDELAIQTATELGVDGVIPWAASRSIVKWEGPKIARHEERWASILREASKQSLRSRIPELRPIATTAELAELATEFRLVILDPEGTSALSALEADGRNTLVVVGPEGGISPAEFTQFAAAGATRFRLGANVMRTSTAGPAALSVLNIPFGRW